MLPLTTNSESDGHISTSQQMKHLINYSYPSTKIKTLGKLCMVKCNKQRTDSVDFLVECRSPEREAAGLKSGDGFPTVCVVVVYLTLA